MKKRIVVLVSVFCLVVLMGNVIADPSNFVERFKTDPTSPDWVYQGPQVPDSMYWEDNPVHGGIVNAKLYRINTGTSWFYADNISAVTGGPVDNTWDWTVSFQLYQEYGNPVYPYVGLTDGTFIGDYVVKEPQYWIGYRIYPASNHAGRFYCDTAGTGNTYSDIANNIFEDDQWYTVEISFDTATSQLDYRVVVDGNEVHSWTKTTSGAFSFDNFAIWDYYSGSSFSATLQYFDNLWIGSTTDYEASDPVTITSQPVSVVLSSGGSNAQFDIAAVNADSYQWYLDGVAISTSDANFAGADSNTLTVHDVQTVDTGVYYCEAYNPVFAADSQKAVLAIEDLVAHYKFDEGSGTTAADSSTYGNDANVIDATFVAAGPVDGKSIAIEPNDPNSRCELLTAANGLPILGLPYTIEAWVNLDEDANNAVTQQIITEYGDGDLVKFYITDYTSSDPAYDYSAVRMHWGINSIRADTYADYVDTIDNWVHYATTFDGTERVIYINGQKITTDEPEEIYNVGSADNFTIGGGDTAGLIDDIKIYNYARTATQIADVVYAVTGEPVCLEVLGYGNKYEGGEDFNRDCKVDFADFADFAENWLDDNLYTTP